MKSISQYLNFSPLQTNEALIVKEKLSSTLPYKNFELASKSTYVGVEVEVEKVPRRFYDISYPMWKVENDGSLRNNGVEFISVPLRGTNLVYSLLVLEEALRNTGCDFSDRTSVHIHLNVRNLSLEQLYKLILIYVVVEPLFYRYVKLNSVDRTNNPFCVPIQEFFPGDPIYYSHISSLLSLSKLWHKYAGFNLLPLNSQGTIEFRQLGGTISTSVIVNWINLIQCLKQAAMTIDIQELRQTVLSLNTNSQYANFIFSIFKQFAVLFQVSNYQKFLEKGISLNKTLFVTPEKVKQIPIEELEVSKFAKLYYNWSGLPIVEFKKGPSKEKVKTAPRRDEADFLANELADRRAERRLPPGDNV